MNEERTIDIRLPRPHKGQQQVLDSKARFKVLQCGRRWGKTLISMVIAIQYMLAGKKVAYVTPKFGQGKDFFRDILQYIPQQLIRTDNKSELLIELITGGSLKFFSGEALDSFRGYKFHMVIIDEAAFIPDLEQAWNNAIGPILDDYQGSAIFISTPRGKNFFYSLFLKGQNKEDGYESFHFATNTNPHYPSEEFERKRKILPEASFRQEYLAIAGENSDNPFGSDNIAKNIITTLSTKPAVVYGIDTAILSDYTVITGLDEDGTMCYFQRFQQPWLVTKERIKQLPSGVFKVMDSTSNLVSQLQELQAEGVANLQGFAFNSTSKPNLIYELIRDVEKGSIKYNEETANEMYVFQYKYSTASNQIKYEAQSGFHDDTVIALALANKYRNQAIANSNWTIYTV